MVIAVIAQVNRGNLELLANVHHEWPPTVANRGIHVVEDGGSVNARDRLRVRCHALVPGPSMICVGVKVRVVVSVASKGDGLPRCKVAGR